MSGDMPEEFVVVVNTEDQYSIWPSSKNVPAGWESRGVRGGKQECIDYINKVWTDMRPRSLREFMDASATERGRPALDPLQREYP